MRLGIESHLAEIQQNANENRQALSILFNNIRKLLQEHETNLKKEISNQLENEEILLKEKGKKLKHHMKAIHKFYEEQSNAKNEEEIEFLIKLP